MVAPSYVPTTCAQAPSEIVPVAILALQSLIKKRKLLLGDVVHVAISQCTNPYPSVQKVPVVLMARTGQGEGDCSVVALIHPSTVICAGFKLAASGGLTYSSVTVGS